MKKITLILLVLIFITHFAQGQGCSYPIDKNTFQEGFNFIAIQATNKRKYDEALIFINSKCLEAGQVKKIAQLIADDNLRLEFCKLAYAHTSDIGNFYDTYDAFQSFSYAFRLHDYVLGLKAGKVETPVTPVIAPAAIVTSKLLFPKYKYPSSVNYAGAKGCEGPVISENEFTAVAENVFAQPTNESKQLAIRNATESYCLDFSQVMKLASLIQPENIRLTILTDALPGLYDQESFRAANALFTSKQLQTEWTAHGTSYLAPPPAPCVEDENEFKESLKSIQSKTFDHDRIEIIEMLAKDHCFSVAQIKIIISQLYPGSGKLQSLKVLYDNCTNKKSYYTLADDLTFSSEKDELKNFIKTRGN